MTVEYTIYLVDVDSDTTVIMRTISLSPSDTAQYKRSDTEWRDKEREVTGGIHAWMASLRIAGAPQPEGESRQYKFMVSMILKNTKNRVNYVIKDAGIAVGFGTKIHRTAPVTIPPPYIPPVEPPEEPFYADEPIHNIPPEDCLAIIWC